MSDGRPPEITSITYSARDEPMDLRPSEHFSLFGNYHFTYSDGCHVLLPHTGYAGTVSATPLDPDDPEQRRILTESAARSRGQWGA